MGTEPEELKIFNYLLFESDQFRTVQDVELPVNRTQDLYLARVNQALQDQGFIADEATIELYLPRASLSINTAESNEWRASIDDPKSQLQRVMPHRFLSSLFTQDLLDDIDIVHLIVVASWRKFHFNYLLFDLSHRWDVHSVQLPCHKLPNDCLEQVAEALQKQGFMAVVHTIQLFKSPDNLSIGEAFLNKWPPTISNPADLDPLSPSLPIYKSFSLEKLDNDKILHLIVTAQASEPTGPSSDVSPLQEHCWAQFRENQRCKVPIYDGRRALEPTYNSSTIALPPSLYHPVFEIWKKNAFDPSFKSPPEVVEATARLMRKASILYEEEKERSYELRRPLQQLLGHHIESIVSTDLSVADSCITCPLKRNNTTRNVPTMIIEETPEAAEGTDATTRATFSMIRVWTDSKLDNLYNLTCCPTFLLGFKGCQLEISAAVIADKCIVERLAILWVGRSTLFDQNRIFDTARVFYALSVALKELAQWYQSDDIVTRPLYNVTANKPFNHPRFFPHADRYPVDGEDFGNTIKFEYLHPLEPSSLCCTFRARTRAHPSDQIVVKFTQRYCPTLHRLLAKHGMAPALRYCGKIDKSTPYRNWQMVVMDYYDGSPPAGGQVQTVSADVRKAVAIGHEADFVFGDIRPPNVLVGKTDGKAKLIDFDWGGKEGEVQYPPDMSDNEILWVDGMQPMEFIQKHHDLGMIGKWFPE